MDLLQMPNELLCSVFVSAPALVGVSRRFVTNNVPLGCRAAAIVSHYKNDVQGALSACITYDDASDMLQAVSEQYDAVRVVIDMDDMDDGKWRKLEFISPVVTEVVIRGKFDSDIWRNVCLVVLDNMRSIEHVDLDFANNDKGGVRFPTGLRWAPRSRLDVPLFHDAFTIPDGVHHVHFCDGWSEADEVEISSYFDANVPTRSLELLTVCNWSACWTSPHLIVATPNLKTAVFEASPLHSISYLPPSVTALEMMIYPPNVTENCNAITNGRHDGIRHLSIIGHCICFDEEGGDTETTTFASAFTVRNLVRAIPNLEVISFHNLNFPEALVLHMFADMPIYCKLTDIYYANCDNFGIAADPRNRIRIHANVETRIMQFHEQVVAPTSQDGIFVDAGNN